MIQTNPFIHGDIVRGDDFLDRKRPLRRLVGRIRTGGSAVVTAEPRMGKTSLLYRVQDEAVALFGDLEDRIIFRYLDGHTMSGWDENRFWEEALRPLYDLPLVKAVEGSQAAFNFGIWEQIFRQLEQDEYRFVLLIDEFSAMQHEPNLHQASVYGALRSLASRHTSFSLIIASRRTTTELNYESTAFAAGSPYFNFVQEITLPPFPQKDMGILLSRGGQFTPADRAFLKRIGGQHPYFLQTAAYFLWDWYEDEDDAITRYEKVGRDFYRSAGETTLSPIWESWTPYMQMAFTITALESMPNLLGAEQNQQFDINHLLRDLLNFAPELRKLETRAFLRKDTDKRSGYAPHAEVMLWYLADELTRVIRPDVGLEQWLTRQQWDGLLKRGEKEALGRAFQQAGGLLKEGASAFIKAAAEGAAKGVTS